MSTATAGVMTEAWWLTSDDPVALLRVVVPDAHGRIATDRKLRLFACGCCRLAGSGVACPRCGGNGGRHSETKSRHENPRWLKCPDCRGTGRVGGLADPRSLRAVEVAERYADGKATAEELLAAYEAAPTEVEDLTDIRYWFGGTYPRERDAQFAALLRCVFRNPLAPRPYWVNAPGHPDGPGLGPIDNPGENWLTPTVRRLAEAAYRERARKKECRACGGTGKLGTEAVLLGLPLGSDCPKCDTGLLDPARLGALADALEEAGCTDQGILGHLRGPGPHCRGCWPLDLLLGKS